MGGSLPPALWKETFRSAHCSSSGEQQRGYARIASLVYAFTWLRAPERHVAALYRVEDQLDGWALQFKEHAACAAGHPPYDLANCMEALLQAGARR